MPHVHDAHATPDPRGHDPAHDVDGKRLTLWLAGSAVGVFATVGILLVLFEQIIEHQRHKTVELTPTTQLDALRAREAVDLAGTAGTKSIDDAIRAYVQKHGGK